eukprot:TRINITY_DN49295_c0_g1_i1.p1 TRINITY_DN49295_c0_g1~~TRINITY_DN49295_c0_g1_i1.p1  ORF type:complete len:759 (+),score=136.37 TRINITY_DN49295_c0_g1_i1:81-2357(+)
MGELSTATSVCYEELSAEAARTECERRQAKHALLGRRLLLRNVALLPLACCSALLLIDSAEAQTPNPNLGSCDKNITDCCQALAVETEEACLEYATYGFDRSICNSWVSLAWQACVESCADCEFITESMYRQCKFQLGPLGDGQLIVDYCTSTIENFRLYRCPSACQSLTLGGINGGDFMDAPFLDLCDSDEGRSCMQECGSWYPCRCKIRRGMEHLPDQCDGDPYVSGTIEYNQIVIKPEREYSCGITPPQCMHHKADTTRRDGLELPARCAKYRKCPVDRCLIKRLVCTAPHQCQEVRICDRDEGRCFFQNKMYGSTCDDGLFYTRDDFCDRGWCTGHIDYCKMYNVTCKPLNECTTGGVCQPHNGRCIYQKKDDGTMCDDRRAYTVEDRCHSGLCVGTFVDLCVDWGIVCKAPNSCFEPGVCDSKTGLCSDPIAKPGAEPCDDGDPNTANDTCIDGICLGLIQSDVPMSFQTMGAGECSDRDGYRMASYVGDVADEKECEHWCSVDAQCQGYAYGYPLCSLYGTIRERPPTHTGRAWAFSQAGFPAAVNIESATMAFTGQKPMQCRRKGWVKDEQDPKALLKNVTADTFFSFQSMMIFFVTLLAVFLLPPCLVKTSRSCRRQRTHPMDDDEADDLDEGMSYETSKSTIAQAPEPLEGEDKPKPLEGDSPDNDAAVEKNLEFSGRAESYAGDEEAASPPPDAAAAELPIEDKPPEMPGAAGFDEPPQAPVEKPPRDSAIEPPAGEPPVKRPDSEAA